MGIHCSKRQTGCVGLPMHMLLLESDEDYLLSCKICKTQVLNCYSLLRNEITEGVTFFISQGVTFCVSEVICQEKTDWCGNCCLVPGWQALQQPVSLLVKVCAQRKWNNVKQPHAEISLTNKVSRHKKPNHTRLFLKHRAKMCWQICQIGIHNKNHNKPPCY